MTDADLLFRAVLAQPEEDTPRLIYADAIQDDRPEYGALIRWQCRHGVSFVRDPEGRWRYDRKRGGGTFPAECWQAMNGLLSGPGSPPRPFTVSRGFVSAITCDAARFLAAADELIWHPLAPCPACKGSGLFRYTSGGTPKADPCRICSGAGLRPCPPTAQPVTSVTLTTMPVLEEAAVSIGAHVVSLPGRAARVTSHALWERGGHEAAVRALLAADWPGVSFDLPDVDPPMPLFPDVPPLPADTAPDFANYSDFTAAQRDDIARALGVPPGLLFPPPG